jgi:regulator of sigma E protease
MGSAKIGISLAPNNFDFQKLPFSKAFVKGVEDGIDIIAQTVGGLVKMVTRQTQADVAGPVKIMKMIKDQSSKGIFDLLYLTAILSVNIGLINLLPLPVLDGGRIVFLLLELLFSIINAITGLKLAITPKVEENIHFIGMLCLLTLLVFVTYKDIASFF